VQTKHTDVREQDLNLHCGVDYHPSSPSKVPYLVEQMLGYKLKTKQTGEDGVLVSKVILSALGLQLGFLKDIASDMTALLVIGDDRRSIGHYERNLFCHSDGPRQRWTRHGRQS